MDDKTLLQSGEIAAAGDALTYIQVPPDEHLKSANKAATEQTQDKEDEQSMTAGSSNGTANYTTESSTSESSAAQVNSISSAANTTNEQSGKGKQKTRERHKNLDKSNLVCGVCGDRSTGFHFGAVSCESCKAFFRRRALKETEPCVNHNNCKMDPINRKFCVDCRLRKCLEIGMRKEWILDEEARAKRKKPTRRASLGSNEDLSRNSQSVCTERKEQTNNKRPSAVPPPPVIDTPPQPLTAEQQDEINKILRQHGLLDTPNLDTSGDLNMSASSKLFTTDSTEFGQLTDQPQHATQVLNMIQGFLTRFIPFIKSLPGYASLNLQDRVAVLKNCMMETMAIRSAIQYDPNIGGFSVEDFSSGARKNLQMQFIRAVFGEELYNEHMNFITSFNSAAMWDRPTMILAMLINLFASDRLDIQNKAVLDESQMHYCDLLQAYLRSRYRLAEAKSIYPRLLLKLADVRDYGEKSRKAIVEQNIASSAGMEPLLQEIFSDGV